MSPAKNHRWSLLVTVGIALVLITLDHSILYTALPTLVHDLGASSTQGLWIINAYPLVMAGLLLGAGTLGDRVGHRRMFLSGMVIFGVASLAAAFAPSPPLLIAARALLAVGAAAMMPATLALIRITFGDVRERNLAIAIWGSLSVVGAALGPILGGLLLERFWWGSVFLINVPVVVAAFAAGWVLAPHTATDNARPWDWLSSVLVMCSLSGLVVAIKEVAHASPSLPLVAAAFAISVVTGVLFVRRQARLPYPLLEFGIFRNPAFSAGVIAAALTLFAISGVQLATTQRYQLIAGFSPLQAGLLVSATALGCLPSALLGGAFLHRTGLRPLVAGGLFTGACGVLLARYGLQAGMPWMVTGLALLGLGLGAVMSVASSAIVGNVPAHRAGMASSVEEVSYEFGSLFAVAVLGSLLAAFYAAGLELPAGAPVAAREGITEALALASADGAGGTALLHAASTAFDRSYALILAIVGAVLGAGSVFTLVLLRRYGPGSATFAVNH